MYVGFTSLLDRRLQSWWKLLTVDVSRSLVWSAVLLSKSRGCVTPGKQSCSLLSSGWRKPLYSMSRLQLRMNTGFGPAIGEPLPFQAKAWAASICQPYRMQWICHNDHDVPSCQCCELIQSGARIRWTASSSLSPATQSILCQRLRVTEEEWTNSLRFGQTDWSNLLGSSECSCPTSLSFLQVHASEWRVPPCGPWGGKWPQDATSQIHYTLIACGPPPERFHYQTTSSNH